MRRQLAGFVLVLCGLLAIGFGVMVAPVATPAAAMPNLQPSVRPTLEPTPDEGDHYRYPTPVPFGRITGTVIDGRTGAPAPNRTVVIGDKAVVSDANGNYDLWVLAGRYPVSLRLGEGEGTAAQGAQEAAVFGNDVVTLHLYFSSPPPLVATPEPATPEPATPEPATPEPVARPVSLPLTGMADAIQMRILLVGGLALLAFGASLLVTFGGAGARPRGRRRP